jgi:S-adenosylmethionine hydrolase
MLMWCCSLEITAQPKALVFQSDFGMKDGAVAAMKGVAFSVSAELKMFDLTHEIPPFNIWEAAYRLNQSAQYWPKETVFVSVVDPGVGSDRKSVVMKTKSGHYFVTPDNGTLTFIAASLGIEAVREIDEAKNRLKNSTQSYTFHGRDVYAYTGARLAAGVIRFNDVGKILAPTVLMLPYQKPTIENGLLKGTIDILDIQYGNVWTNIDQATFKKVNIEYGDTVDVKIFLQKELKYEASVLFGRTFADVNEGEPIAYMNSLMKFSLGINMDNLAEKHKIGSGAAWTIVVSKRGR